jgi:thiol:disulfide interchange protein
VQAIQRWFAFALLSLLSLKLAGAEERSNLLDSSLLGSKATSAHTTARLVLSAATARPGDTVTAGVHLRMETGWHTYWKNSGASGMPTKIQWQFPAGIAAGEIQWPLPEKLGPDDLTTYIYHGETVLLVALKIGAEAKPGPLEIKANASWLECKNVCIPADATVKATLQVAETNGPSPDAAWLETWKKKLPNAAEGLAAHARWEKSASGDTRSLILEWAGPTKFDRTDFFPYAAETFEVQPDVVNLSDAPGKIRVRKVVKKFEADWPKEISGVLVIDAGGKTQGFEVKLPIGAGGASLWRMLLYAFIGGLILNVMPCVLPVIALKILGFVGQARQDPRAVRKLGLIYTAGVLASFLALAAIVIGVKAAGSKAGWGFQFGNPYFIVAMTTLVTVIALNLFGAFEVTLGGGALTAADKLSGRHGAAGAFFNGLLATVLATSCTAPILGAAVGYAFAQPPAIIVMMMLTVGLGLAAPYLLVSWQPKWLRFLPKPGPWMKWFKFAMGIPMTAAALWLLSLAQTHYAERTRWLGVFLVFVALAAWVYGAFMQRGTKHRGLALGGVAALLIAGYAYALEGQLRWREPMAADATEGSLKESPDGIDWQRWSPQAVSAARAAGRPVFVDFTARWCLTCQANKKFSIEIPSVRTKLKEINAAALLGDYTRFPPEITEELNRYERAGVPLVLVYPRDASQPPFVLPEALTPGIVLNALAAAAK